MDFNDATGKQRKTDLIPANTIAAVAMHVRSGNAGPGGWLKRAKDGRSEALDVEFTVIDGEFARRKFWASVDPGRHDRSPWPDGRDQPRAAVR